jgi:hypothetical protein
VAVKVQIRVASRAASSLWESWAFFLVTTGSATRSAAGTGACVHRGRARLAQAVAGWAVGCGQETLRWPRATSQNRSFNTAESGCAQRSR